MRGRKVQDRFLIELSPSGQNLNFGADSRNNDGSEWRNSNAARSKFIPPFKRGLATNLDPDWHSSQELLLLRTITEALAHNGNNRWNTVGRTLPSPDPRRCFAPNRGGVDIEKCRSNRSAAPLVVVWTTREWKNKCGSSIVQRALASIAMASSCFGVECQ